MTASGARSTRIRQSRCLPRSAEIFLPVVGTEKSRYADSAAQLRMPADCPARPDNAANASRKLPVLLKKTEARRRLQRYRTSWESELARCLESQNRNANRLLLRR